MAKKGEGVKKSEKRRESAETAYHRLLYEESMHQVVQHLVMYHPPVTHKLMLLLISLLFMLSLVLLSTIDFLLKLELYSQVGVPIGVVVMLFVTRST